MRIEDYIANKIHGFRTSHGGGRGMSQTELASLLGTTANTISRWETGQYKPSVSDIEKLSKALGVAIRDFFPDDKYAKTDELAPLYRAVEGLSQRDIEEIKHFAEFRKARSLLNKPRPTPGRKRKNE